MGWDVGPDEVESIALGSGILGTGGGGNPYLGKLHLLQELKQGARVRVVDPSDIGDDDVVIAVSGMGAPTVSLEKLSRGQECYEAFMALERHTGTHAVAVVPGEIGGSNSMTPLIVAAQGNVPCVDADPMGRAFPELDMDTFAIYGVSPSPAALCDAQRNIVVLDSVATPKWAEHLFRAATIAMGGSAGLAMPYMRGAKMKSTAIWGSMSLALRLGSLVRAARREKSSPIDAILTETDGILLFTGKIIDVGRRTTAGFAKGSMTILGHGAYAGESMGIEFQNENLVARIGETVVATVPDLICVVEEETAEPIGTEVLRYGLRVAVLGLPADPKLRTSRALEVVGPPAFGYDLPFVPLETAKVTA